MNKLYFGCIERVSTDKQARKGQSLEDQKLGNVKDVEQLNGTIICHYTESESATPGKQHPLISNVKNDIEVGRINAVITQFLDRISRDQIEAAIFYKYLRDHNIELYEKTTRIDLDDCVTKLHVGMRTLFAEYNALDYFKRSYKARYEKSKKGFCSLGHHPFGYKVSISKDNKPYFEIIPEHVNFLNKFYEYYVKQKLTTREAQKILVRDELWPVIKDTSNLRTLDPTHLMKLATDYAERTEFVINPKEPGYEQIRHKLPGPLLSKEKIFAIRERAKKNRINNHKKIHFYDLAGYVYCGHCGLSMRGTSANEYRYYRHSRTSDKCVNHIRAEDLEKVIFYEISIFLGRTDKVTAAIENAFNSATTKKEEIKNELIKIERELRNQTKQRNEYLSGVGVAKSEGVKAELIQHADEIQNGIQRLEKDKGELLVEYNYLKSEISEDLPEKIHMIFMELFNRTSIQLLDTNKKQDLLNILIGGGSNQLRKKKRYGIYLYNDVDDVINVNYFRAEIRGALGIIKSPIEMRINGKSIIHEHIYDFAYYAEYASISLAGFTELVAAWKNDMVYRRNGFNVNCFCKQKCWDQKTSSE